MENFHLKMKENMRFAKEFSNQSQNSVRLNKFNSKETPMNSPMSDSRINKIAGI